MIYSLSSCSNLFLCTAVFCWNNQKILFNITECSPESIYFQSNLYLLSSNNYSNIKKNDFICSNCTRNLFSQFNSKQINQCDKKTIKVKLINICQYLLESRQNIPIHCQCFPSNQSVHHWIKALEKPSKRSENINRINRINQSPFLSIFILISSIFFILILGGIISIIIFYSIKYKSNQLRTLK